MSLHNEIMNIQDRLLTDYSPKTPSEVFCYKSGHRDARHAAAELALKYDAKIEELAEAIERTGALLSSLADNIEATHAPLAIIMREEIERLTHLYFSS